MSQIIIQNIVGNGNVIGDNNIVTNSTQPLFMYRVYWYFHDYKRDYETGVANKLHLEHHLIMVKISSFTIDNCARITALESLLKTL